MHYGWVVDTNHMQNTILEISLWIVTVIIIKKRWYANMHLRIYESLDLEQ
mgnify:CR=1 FL=1